MYGFIYITTNTINGKRYIGKCSYANCKHRTYLGSGNLLRKAISKYGANFFTRDVVEECETADALNQAERKWIDHFDAVNDPMFYNLVPGGSGTSMGFRGKTHSVERNERMRQLLRGRKRPEHVREALRRANLGKTVSQKCREARRERLIGGNHFRAKAVTIDGITYPTIKQASDATGITYGRLQYRFGKHSIHK